MGVPERFKNWINDPKALRRFHGRATLFWMANLPIVVATSLGTNQRYLVVISVWALVAGHWASWQGARTEVKEDERE